MRFTGYVLFSMICWLMVAVPARGHHALAAEYDLSRSIVVTGTVKKVDWINPHVLLYLDTRGSKDPMHWELEMSSPNLLALHGLKIDSLRPGDNVTVTANPARNGSNLGYARVVSHSSH